MKNEEAHNYYTNRINSEKKTGYLFDWIPFPPGSPLIILILNTILFAFFGVYSSHSILIFMVFRTKGVDPNFPNDPLYVTLSDREDIFDDYYETIEDQISFDNFQKHYFFILTFTASYIIVCLIFKFGFDF